MNLSFVNFTRTLLLVAIVIPFTPVSILANQEGAPKRMEGPEFPKTSIQIIDEKGKVRDLKWRNKLEWTWATENEKSSVRVPTLQLRVLLPNGWQRINDKTQAPVPGRILEINIRKNLVSEAHWFQTPKGSKRNLTFFIQTEPVFTKILEDDSCVKEGIRVKEISSGEPILAVGVKCREAPDDQFDMAVFYTEDATWKKSTLGQTRQERGRMRVYRVKKPQPPKVLEKDISSEIKMEGDEPQAAEDNPEGEAEAEPAPEPEAKPDLAALLPIGTFSLDKEGTGSTSVFQVEFGDPEALTSGRRFSFSAGFGGTYLKFTQSPNSIQLTEIAITVKGAVVYDIWPKYFDIGLSFYANVFAPSATLTSTSVDLLNSASSDAKFYGINFRIGYKLPFSSRNSRYSVLLGYYMWGMIASNFGVQSLFGPQIFFSGSWRVFDGRALYGYAKFAPISNGGISFSNRELAAGMGLQVNSTKSSNPIFVTLDVSKADVSAIATDIVNVTSAFSLTTYSLGASIGL